MSGNQFRRDPITSQWSIILEDKYDIKKLITHTKQRQPQVFVNKTKYSEGNESKTLPEIYALREHHSTVNGPGWKVRIIPYDQPFLEIYGGLKSRGIGLYDVIDGVGAHELVIEAPTANIQMYDMGVEQIKYILEAYRERIIDLKRDNRFRCIIVHKNYGEGSGDLDFHAHSHIIATPITPARFKNALINAQKHYRYKERCLFCDIIFQEITDDERIIIQNEHYIALAPFASRAPFSVWILPKKHQAFFENDSNYDQLASILKEILTKIKNILNDPNYVMVLNTGPNLNTGREIDYWKTLDKDYHWYFEIIPRLRSFTSFEMGSGILVNVVPPERAAAILRSEIID